MGAKRRAEPAMHAYHGFVVLLVPMYRPEWAGKDASAAANASVVVDAHTYLGLSDGAHRARSSARRIWARPTNDHHKTSFHTAHGTHGNGGAGEPPFPKAPGTS